MVSIIKLRAFSVVVVLSLFTACKKDDGLTKETQTGANTFSCKIDGQLFTTKGELFSPKPVWANYSNGISSHNLPPYLIVTGSNFSLTPNVEVQLNLNGEIQVGSYKLDSTSTGQVEYWDVKDDIYITDAQHTGEVTLTYVDHSSGIYAGRFSFTGINSAGQAREITSGRFDVKTK